MARTEKRTIDLGINGVKAEFLADGQPRIVVALTHGRRLFDEHTIDRNTYKKGYVRRHGEFPGTTGTQEMGLSLAENCNIEHIQFRRNEGVFMKVRPGIINYEPLVRQIARQLLDFADAFRSQSAPAS